MRARGRAWLSTAFVVVALAACQEAVAAGDSGPSPFEALPRKGAPTAVGPAGRRLGPFELLTQRSARSELRPARTGAPPAARAAAVLPGAGPVDGSAYAAAHGFPEWQPPPTTTTTLPPPLLVPTGPEEWFNPRGQHEGTEGIVADLAKLGVANNGRLYVNECWGRTWGAATSDHHTTQKRSWACDLSVPGVQVPTPEGHEAARRIGSALGVPNWKGGNLTKTVNGYRVQVLWMVAGHFNHVHIGVRKV